MVSRTPSEAVNNYVDSIQLAVSCVSNSVVTVRGGYYPDSTPHTLALNNAEPVRLGGISGLWLLLEQQYRIVQSDPSSVLWTISEVRYEYIVFDADGREVFAYHWHPGSNSPIVTPHLHIGYGAMVGRAEVSDAHFITGYVRVNDILRMLIRDFSVTPRREDWESVLNEVSAADSG